MVEPVQGSRSTDPEPGRHSKLPNMFSAAAPVQPTGSKGLIEILRESAVIRGKGQTQS